MNEKIVFVRTNSGEDEARSKTAHLSKDIKRALLMVDGTSTVAEIIKRASPSLREVLGGMFVELVKGGFIRDKSNAVSEIKMAVPHIATPSSKNKIEDSEELDFTSVFHVATPAIMAQEAAKVAARAKEEVELARVKAEKVQVEANVRAVAEEKARLEAEVAKLKAQAETAAQARAVEEQARLEVAKREQAKQEEARLKALEEAQVREQAERRAREEAEVARIRAAQVKAEAEARERALAERRAREEADAVRIQMEMVKAEAEARARAVAEEKARLEAEVAKLKAQAEARARAAEEQARLEAVQREEARLKALDEAREREQRRVREEVEAARLKAEQVKAEAEARERAQVERRAREQAEAVRIKAEQAKEEAEARARAMAEEKDRLEAEVTRLKVQAEEEARAAAEVLAKKEIEVAKVRADQEAAERRAHEEVEAQRTKVEKAKAEAHARAEEQHRRNVIQLAEQEVKVKTEREHIDRLKIEEVEVQTNEEMLASVVKLNAKHAAVETNVFIALDEQVKQQEALNASIPPMEDRRKIPSVVAGYGSRRESDKVPVVERRTTTAAVVFFDIVGYTKQSDTRQIELKQQFNSLVTNSIGLLDATEHIILDTGDGAAIGFMQHPTDALEMAMHFRTSIMAHKHADFPEMKVRIGINLGPVSLVKDMNGQTNMLGDGINSAQRVMGFAGDDQIYVSRTYFDFVSSLSDEYEGLFRYHGSKLDKHGREHQVYELLDMDVATDEPEQGGLTELQENLPEFNFEAFDSQLAQSVEQISQKNQLEASVEIQLSEPSIAEAINVEKSKPAKVSGIRFDEIKLDKLETVNPDVIKLDRLEPVKAEVSIAQKVEVGSKAETSLLVLQLSGTEEEAKQLADEQARKWAEAEQRAAEQVRKNADLAAHKAAQPSVVADKSPEKIQGKTPDKISGIHVRRKPVPWGKISVGVILILIAALFASPYLLLTQATRTRIEQQLGTKLQQPVHIAGLSGRILPRPSLVLSEVSVGESKQIQLREVRVNFALPALLGSSRAISRLELDGMQINGAVVTQMPGWLQQLAADTQYPIAHVGLTQATLEADGIKFSDVTGELDFDAAGSFVSAKLEAADNKLAVDIHATPGQKTQLSISLRNSALPLFPNWQFDDMTASGELTADELHIANLDGRIMGGILTGEARLNWSSGWKAQGTLVSKVVPSQNLNKFIDGDMDGSANFRMHASSLGKLADAAVFNGVFTIGKGTISGVDIVESARLGSRANAQGGRTHFEKLSGEFAYSNGSYQFKQLRMSDSVVNAYGWLNIDKQKLSGSLSASLAILGGGGSTALQIGGTTEAPSFRAR